MWKQLTGISILVFSGDKWPYGRYKAAFAASINKAPATAEYTCTLLQFYTYPSGEPLQQLRA